MVPEARGPQSEVMTLVSAMLAHGILASGTERLGGRGSVGVSTWQLRGFAGFGLPRIQSRLILALVVVFVEADIHDNAEPSAPEL